ncbi:amidase [Actinomadura chibensis]|uniref:Amidase n=1 Tax=Actinomadura chibensis TaxID=392828 RepID=A0A5D0NVG1_9ACTN|nr:amidase [Actinomadura chibensis]TYB48189.1 amidase [Actinomadura chibensis]
MNQSSDRLAVPPDAICRMSARELHAAYAARELSPVEVLDAVLSRAEQVDPALSALYWRFDESARAAAVAAERRWLRGAPLGRLDGLPVTAKDNMDVPGAPTYLGSRTNLFTRRPTATDPLVAAFLDRGAVLFAKSTMVETGLFSGSFSALYGPVRNPWNLAKSAGGSTSGGAAATAARIGPVHLGTDGGGSLRSPAASCGCVALKATAHSGPFGHPPGDVPASSGVRGFLTRDADDQTFVLGEFGEPVTEPRPVEDLRVGYLPAPTADPGVGDVHPIVRAAVEAALDRLDGTVRLEEVPEPLFEGPMWEAAVTAAFAGVARSLDAGPPELAGRLHPVVGETVARARAAGSADRAGEEVRRLAAIHGRRLASAFERYDLLVLACNYYPSFDAELPWHDECALIEPLGYGWTSGACPHIGWADGGPPSVSVPCGLDPDGVPIGLLIAGRPGADADVLRAARRFEEVLTFTALF